MAQTDTTNTPRPHTPTHNTPGRAARQTHTGVSAKPKKAHTRDPLSMGGVRRAAACGHASAARTAEITSCRTSPVLGCPQQVSMPGRSPDLTADSPGRPTGRGTAKVRRFPSKSPPHARVPGFKGPSHPTRRAMASRRDSAARPLPAHDQNISSTSGWRAERAESCQKARHRALLCVCQSVHPLRPNVQSKLTGRLLG